MCATVKKWSQALWSFIQCVLGTCICIHNIGISPFVAFVVRFRFVFGCATLPASGILAPEALTPISAFSLSFGAACRKMWAPLSSRLPFALFPGTTLAVNGPFAVDFDHTADLTPFPRAVSPLSSALGSLLFTPWSCSGWLWSPCSFLGTSADFPTSCALVLVLILLSAAVRTFLLAGLDSVGISIFWLTAKLWRAGFWAELRPVAVWSRLLWVSLLLLALLSLPVDAWYLGGLVLVFFGETLK